MVAEPWSCGPGFHAYVREHPPGERPPGPGRATEGCRRCGRRRGEPGVPMGVIGG